MNYAVEMGSGSLIYMPSLIKIVFGIQELLRVIFIDIQRAR
jgi:hypothetical protein